MPVSTDHNVLIGFFDRLCLEQCLGHPYFQPHGEFTYCFHHVEDEPVCDQTYDGSFEDHEHTIEDLKAMTFALVNHP